MQTIQSNRIEVYDWLRGLACIAVIFNHFKLFQPSGEMYLLWSIHAFVVVTLALAAKSSLSKEKVLRRLTYVIYVYLICVFTFAPFFKLSGHEIPFSKLLLNPVTIFIENPFFSHLWYLCLYGQILLFLLFFLKKMHSLPPLRTLAVTLIISQIMFAGTHYGLRSLEALLLPSWFFVMAFGFYVMPHWAEKIQAAHAYRGIRAGATLLFLLFFFANTSTHVWMGNSENIVFILNTLIFFLILYLLIEIYFLISRVRWMRPIILFLTLTSRYTLILYIYHQGFWTLLKAWAPDHSLLFTAVCLVTGLAYGYAVHESYLQLEKKILSFRLTPILTVKPNPVSRFEPRDKPTRHSA